MNKKKIIFSVIALSAIIGLVFAAWIMTPQITGYSVYQINSNKGNLTIERYLMNESFDTTNSSFNYTDVFIVESAINEPMRIYLYTNKTDVEDACFDYIDDCAVTYWWGNYSNSEFWGYGVEEIEQLFSGDLQLFRKDRSNVLSIYINCFQFSCPQELSARIVIERLPPS